MGLGESEIVASPCSICLEAVMNDGERSFAKLLCGHGFHLDCIGSAFNAKGRMQCPNCRNVEKGNWLYGNGDSFSPTVNTDEWTHDDELYHLNFLEMPYTIRWCPIDRIGTVTTSFENGQSFSLDSLQDLVGHHVITELPSIGVPAEPCPHMSGFHQVPPASAPTFHTSSDGITETSLYNHQRSQVSGSTEVPSHQSLPTGDAYHGRDRHQSTHSHLRDITTASIQAPVSHAAPPSTRLEDGGPPRASFPFHSFTGRHSSSNRAPARTQDRHQQANISADPRPSLWAPSNQFNIYMYPVSFNSSAGDMMSTGAPQRSRVQFTPFTSQTSLTESGSWTGSRRRNFSSERLVVQTRAQNLIYWSSGVRSYL